MIITESGNGLVTRYSDRGFKIRQEQTGVLYDSATDLADAEYTYAETDIPINDESGYTEAAKILLGVNE